jgi:hypothetical protein
MPAALRVPTHQSTRRIRAVISKWGWTRTGQDDHANDRGVAVQPELISAGFSSETSEASHESVEVVQDRGGGSPTRAPAYWKYGRADRKYLRPAEVEAMIKAANARERRRAREALMR